MAVHLKKRALADFSHTIEENVRPAKQLQLSYRLPVGRSRSVEQLAQLDWNPANLTEPYSNVMNGLLNTQNSLPLQNQEARDVIEGLLARLHFMSATQAEDETGLISKDILAQVLILLPLVVNSLEQSDPMVWSKVVDRVCQCGLQWISRDRQQDSDKAWPGGRVISLAIGAASEVAKQGAGTPSVRQQALQFALAAIANFTNNFVKISCLKAIGNLCDTQNSSDSINILLQHASHPDSRVRTAALKAMAECEQRQIPVPSESYTEACNALDDDFQCVREAAILLVKVIACTAPDRLMPTSGGDGPERLADHAFFCICGCMCDSSVRVRVAAANALSVIPGVSTPMLLQTLDKKLFSNLKRKMSYHERKAALVSSGEWSRGRQWGDDVPKQAVDAEQTSITHSAGAFVHGLEDECLEVRNASLDALAVLAEGSHSFANQCLDFLVDMFNDEIEEVRLKAVQVLKRIVKQIRLQEDQLDEILHALKDGWQRIRQSVHSLLGACSLTTPASLQATVVALLDNIRRYPQDEKSIQECMVQLGRRQAGLVAGLVPQLLLIHPYFDAVQPSLHQPHYICKLLLVLNAASVMPTILPLLEEHTMSHYSYLRDTLPHLVPKLQDTGSAHLSQCDIGADTETFLQQSLSKLRRLEHASSKLRLTLYSCVHADLIKLAALDPTMSAAAQFTALYTRCSLLLTRLLNCSGWLQLESSGNNVQQLVELTFRLVHAFTGLSAEAKTCARGIRLRALALQLVYVVNGSTGSALGLCETFLNHARPQKSPDSSSEPDDQLINDSFLNAVLTQLKDEKRPGIVARTLQPLLSLHPPTPLPALVNPRAMHQAHAKISQPSQDSEVVHKLTAGLLLAVQFDAQLFHIVDPSAVRIKISYPDQNVHYIVPRVNDLQPSEEEHCFRLQTTVSLTAGVWSEACLVNISLVLDLTPIGPKRKHDPHTIDLCSPSSLMLWPKPMMKKAS